jgi:hypothetical protein
MSLCVVVALHPGGSSAGAKGTRYISFAIVPARRRLESPRAVAGARRGGVVLPPALARSSDGPRATFRAKGRVAHRVPQA